MKGLKLIFFVLLLLIGWSWFLPPNAFTSSVPVAVFPLQELGEGRNDVNLAFTRILAERLAKSGNEITPLDKVISFMANNRIRVVGRLETYQILKVMDDLRTPFVLLGTVTEHRETQNLTLGLTLYLVRASDARTVWSYTDSLSINNTIKILGIGQARTIYDLQNNLLDEIVQKWPWHIINDIQVPQFVTIDTAMVAPDYVKPGGQIQGRVNLRIERLGGQEPKVFFKAEDQFYPANPSKDAGTYYATWSAGKKNGTVPVYMYLEWPQYGYIETVLLDNYLIDGTPPVFELEVLGERSLIDGIQMFRGSLTIAPRMIVRKSLSRWRISYYYEDEDLRVAELDGVGDMPVNFTWSGVDAAGIIQEDGLYKVVLEAWDKADNYATASTRVYKKDTLPDVLARLKKLDEKIIVNLEDKNKVPLKYWRFEMWSKDGKFLGNKEGVQFPATFELELDDAASQTPQIDGFLFYQDTYGVPIRKALKDLLPAVVQAQKKDIPAAGISKKWVNEF